MAEENAADENDFKKENGGDKNYLLLLILLLNTVLMGGVAFLQFKSLEDAKKQESIRDIIKAEMKAQISEEEGGVEGEAKHDDGKLFKLNPFTANLAQGDGPRRYVRLSTVLKFSAKSNEEEFKARKPQIRDSVISILNSKRPEELLKREGKSYLKEEIKSAINAFLIDGNVIDVFYVSFQIN